MTEPRSEPSCAPVVGGRYRLREEIGRGGGGVVRQAEDLLTGEVVAVKTVRSDVPHRAPRARREALAMRLLRIPGVVALRDEIVEGDATHMVMDLVDGEPFPGPLADDVWERIAPRVRAFLEILARVHAAGIVHRDLKPANVLVDSCDRVTLLDFGVSWGLQLGPAVTQPDTIVGTPEYLAPEQIGGRGNDPRVDLYATGVMLYEVLAGRPPHPARDFGELVVLKRSGRIEPLERLAPKLPRHVVQTVTSLLALDPAERPPSARAALRLLFGDAEDDPALAPLPRIGGRATLDVVLDAVRRGASLDVWGERGSGRSRLLADVADELRAEGRVVRWLCDGRSPYASLEGVVGPVAAFAATSRDEAQATAEASVRAALARGEVVLADDPQRVDRWSADALARCRSAGAVLRVVATPTEGCLRMPRLAEEDLRPVFAGPSRLLHLPEDAAAELWRRTGGHPAAVRSEIAAWVRAGIAKWNGGRLVVAREAIDRLRFGAPVGVEVPAAVHATPSVSPEFDEILAWVQMAWPHATTEQVARACGRPSWIVESVLGSLADDGAVRVLPNGVVLPLASSDTLARWSDEARRSAHAALADALPAGSLERLRHLAAAGMRETVVREATDVARSLADEGRAGDAVAALQQAIDAATELHDPAATLAAIERLASVCLLLDTPGSLSHALWHLDRAQLADPRAQAVREFLETLTTASAGDAALALQRIAACPPFADAELERWRRVWIVRAADRVSVEAMEWAVEDFGTWAAQAGDDVAAVHHAEALARLRWRQFRLGDAAAAYRTAADSHPTGRGRLAALLNLGSVLLECGQIDEARAAADAAHQLAASRRNPVLEAYAESLRRDVAYARREIAGADLEFLDAVSRLQDMQLAAWTHVREAAAAWRAGELSTAAACAQAGADYAGVARNTGLRLLSRCLDALCARPPRTWAIELVEEAARAENPRDAVEALALLTISGGETGNAARRAFLHAAARMTEPLRAAPGTVLGFAEAVALAGGSGSPVAPPTPSA